MIDYIPELSLYLQLQTVLLVLAFAPAAFLPAVSSKYSTCLTHTLRRDSRAY